MSRTVSDDGAGIVFHEDGTMELLLPVGTDVNGNLPTHTLAATLLYKVATDTELAEGFMNWAVAEIEKRGTE